jgi:hypothetical protein
VVRKTCSRNAKFVWFWKIFSRKIKNKNALLLEVTDYYHQKQYKKLNASRVEHNNTESEVINFIQHHTS